MPVIRLHASLTIPAPAAAVYEIIADYRNGHPQILPRPPFVAFHVEEGGRGDGTVIRFQMRSFGRVQEFRAGVTEPEPGRILVESDLDTDSTTTFTVNALSESSSEVSIETQWSAPWPRAIVERVLAPPFLRRVYAKELRNLSALARDSLR